MPLDCIRHGSVVGDGGWNHRNCLESCSRAVDKLTVSCLYKAEYWYWHKQQHSELWWDWGFPLSSRGYGQENMHAHEHTHRHRVLWVRPFGQLLESWTLTPTCVLSPWEADGWCLFGFAVANAHTHTHTRCHDWNTQTRGRGRAGLPSLILLSCVDFGLCLEIFVSFKFSISSLRDSIQNPTEAFFRLTGNQPVSLVNNELRLLYKWKEKPKK